MRRFWVLGPSGNFNHFATFQNGIPIIYAISTASAGIPLDLYNPVKLGVGCWVAPYPIGCEDDAGISGVACQRGGNVLHMGLSWNFGGPCVECGDRLHGYYLFTSTTAEYRRIERRYYVVQGQNQRSAASAKYLRLTLQQATLYICSFILTYLFIYIRVVENNGQSTKFFGLSLMSRVFYPSQGFFNFFIYVRPKRLELRTQFPDKGHFELYRGLFKTPASGDTTAGPTSPEQQRNSILGKAL
jgi:hypothetical protein